MSRLNIQHPITKEWRCFSTVVDNWVSDWMSEDKYKEFLIQKAIDDLKAELEYSGIRHAYYYSYNDAVFAAARMDWKDMHCKSCKNSCDNCPVYQYDAGSYMTDCDDDFLGCMKDMIKDGTIIDTDYMNEDAKQASITGGKEECN